MSGIILVVILLTYICQNSPNTKKRRRYPVCGTVPVTILMTYIRQISPNAKKRRRYPTCGTVPVTISLTCIRLIFGTLCDDAAGDPSRMLSCGWPDRRCDKATACRESPSLRAVSGTGILEWYAVLIARFNILFVT